MPNTGVVVGAQSSSLRYSAQFPRREVGAAPACRDGMVEVFPAGWRATLGTLGRNPEPRTIMSTN